MSNQLEFKPPRHPDSYRDTKIHKGFVILRAFASWWFHLCRISIYQKLAVSSLFLMLLLSQFVSINPPNAVMA